MNFRRAPRMMSAHAAYELWAPTYPPIAHNPLMRVEQNVIETLLRGLRVKRALDVGTGSGRYVPLLAATGASVVGVDFSMAMLAHHRRSEEHTSELQSLRHLVCRPL